MGCLGPPISRKELAALEIDYTVGSMLVLKTKSDDEWKYVGVKARLTLRGDEMADQAVEKRKKTLTSPKETYSPVTVPPTMKMLQSR